MVDLQLEKRVNEVEQFYLTKGSLQPTTSKEKDRDKHFNSIKKQQQDASRREAAAAKRMRDLLNKFSAIFKQVSTNLMIQVTSNGCKYLGI